MAADAGLIELMLVLGGVLAFAAWQFHDLNKYKKDKARREKQEEGEEGL